MSYYITWAGNTSLSFGEGRGEVCVATGANHGAVLGGFFNQVFGKCSAILGGNGNNDAGFANAHIVGSGITAVAANTLHVNALWANAMPGPGPAGLLAGTIYYDNVTVPGYGTAKFLMIV